MTLTKYLPTFEELKAKQKPLIVKFNNSKNKKNRKAIMQEIMQIEIELDSLNRIEEKLK